jgi:hypothetical protein
MKRYVQGMVLSNNCCREKMEERLEQMVYAVGNFWPTAATPFLFK